LKTLVGVMLGSQQPMLIVWGEAHITLYNDGYAPMCGARHPHALGRPFDEVWHDIWDQVEPILSRAYAGEATHMDDISFTMHRNGYPE
ncbi:histidine kinase, partial [Klebsiella oxytoca]